MLSIYISNERIKLVEAKVTGKKITIKNLYSVVSPNEYFDNPEEKYYKELSGVIAEGIREINPSGKKVRIVLDDNSIPFKEIILPSLPSKKMITLIKNEIFTDEKLANSNTVDYIEVEKRIDNLKRSKFFVSYIDNNIIDQMDRMINKDIGFKLLSIDVAQNAISKIINTMSKNLPNSFILVDYKDSSLTVYLFVDGKQAFSMSKKVLAVPSLKFQNEKMYFINEISSTLLEAISFFNQKYKDIEFDTVFVTGNTETFSVCANLIAAKIGYNVNVLPQAPNIENVDENEFNEFSNAIGGFLRE